MPRKLTARTQPATRRGAWGRSGDQFGAEASDADLIAAVRSGSGDAFTELWGRYRGIAAATAAQLVPHSDVQDLVNEVYLKTFDAIRRGLGPDFAFRSYLVQSVRNTAQNWSVSSRNLQIEDIEPHEYRLSSPAVMSYENATVLRGVFSKLPSTWQQVLWAVEVEGISTAEAADRLGMTSGNVATTAFRARAKLREYWFSAHLNTRNVPMACAPFVERLAVHLAEKRPEQYDADVLAHVASCEGCAARVAEARQSAHSINVFAPLGAGVALLWHSISRAPAAAAMSVKAAASASVLVTASTAVAAAAVVGGAILVPTLIAAQSPAATGSQLSSDARDPATTETTPDSTNPDVQPATDDSATNGTGTTSIPPNRSEADSAPSAPKSSDAVLGADATDIAPEQASSAAGAVGAVGASRSIEAVPFAVTDIDTGGQRFQPYLRGTGFPGAAVLVTLNGVLVDSVAVDSNGVWVSRVGDGGRVGVNELLVSERLSSQTMAEHPEIAQNRSAEYRSSFTLRAPSANATRLAGTGRDYLLSAAFDAGSLTVVQGAGVTFEKVLSDPSGVASAQLRLAASEVSLPFAATIQYVSPDFQRAGPAVSVALR